MLLTLATSIAIHPVHVRGGPITGHKSHASFQRTSSHHCIELAVGTPAVRFLSAPLSQSGYHNQSRTFQFEFLRKSERFRRVDGVSTAHPELKGLALGFWIPPFVAFPVWVAVVRSCTCMIGNLHNRSVHLVYVIFRATAQTFKALGVAIIIAILAWLSDRRVHQVKIDVAAACCRLYSIPTKFHVNAKSLTDKFWFVVPGCIAKVFQAIFS